MQNQQKPAPAVVLLSGGLDSATCLAMATSQGFACRALTINYGQRHIVEIQAAERMAQALGAVKHLVLKPFNRRRQESQRPQGRPPGVGS